MSEGPLFILAGNGAHLNRGCEAILRGTVNLLRKQYQDPRFLCVSFFKTVKEFQDQRRKETDPGIEHRSCFHPSRKDALSTIYRPVTWAYLYRSLINEGRLGRSLYREMAGDLPEAAAVLSIAADNYSLFHGTARLFVALDEFVLENQRPLVLWGASVGPFDREPEYERFMSAHLRKADSIIARESVTADYLERIGVAENVFRAADPAFLMEAARPPKIRDDFPVGEEAIGLNFSDRMARHAAGGDADAWTRTVASVITEVRKRTGLPVYLIPHGTRACSNDHTFMARALSLVKDVDNIVLMPPGYNAAETKWIIGRMTAFAGVRTHSVIASLSSKVPTLTLGYGPKSLGINRDIFGHTEHCLRPDEIDPSRIADRLASLVEDRSNIKDELSRGVPAVVEAAAGAGRALKEITDS